MDAAEYFFGNINPRLSAYIRSKSYSTVFWLADSNTAEYCLPKIDGMIDPIIIEPGERNKTIITCDQVWKTLLKKNADRYSLLVNVGGGLVTDLGGFAASTFKRGIHYINVPTTLLAMVDASIGGKTGINLSGFKNQVGTFSIPRAVFMDEKFLETLPHRELTSAIAEIVKYGLIAKPDLINEVSAILSSGGPWDSVIRQCVEIKTGITSRDPHENRERKFLNFGHTAGHAIESFFQTSETPLLHGEAVALGIKVGVLLSVRKLGFNLNDARPALDILDLTFKKIKIPESEFNRLIAFMSADKKNKKGDIRFVLLEKMGSPLSDISCSRSEIIDALTATLT